MKTFFTIWMIAALTRVAGAVELKVATVDLQRLVQEYYRAQEVAEQLAAKQAGFAKELAELRLDGQRLVKETRELQERSADPALSLAGRDETKKLFDLKLSDLRAFEMRYESTKAQRESEFQNQVTQANRRLLDEVLTTTRRIGDSEGFHLVLNSSKTNPASSDVLFAKQVDDITEKVLASLNATKPVSPSPSNVERRP
jgi:outer membrane protein